MRRRREPVGPGSTSVPRAPARGRGRRRTSAPSRTTSRRSARSASPRAARRGSRWRGRPSRPGARVIAIPQSARSSSAAAAARGRTRSTRCGGVPLGRELRAPRHGARGRTANVIESGQPTPASAYDSVMKRAARATWPSSAEWSPCATPSPRSACQAGWNSTSSIRSPKRSWSGGPAGARSRAGPSSSGSPPQSRPNAAHRCSSASPPPSRRSASTSGRFSEKRS